MTGSLAKYEQTLPIIILAGHRIGQPNNLIGGASMQFILNGQQKEYDGDPTLPLLTFLREHEGIISPKDGCAPQAACGCCVVQLNNRAVLACVTPMKKVADSRVTTIEGLDAYRQEVFANSFVSKGGVQCGFCIPGIVMQSNVLIDKNPEPDRAAIEKALTPHLCRCTGYKNIIDAVLDVTRKLPGDAGYTD